MSAMQFAQWRPHLSLGITGHRASNSLFAANREAVIETLSSVFDTIDRLRLEQHSDQSSPRLHSLLAGGVDQIAAELARKRDWRLIAPLPFGAGLNVAINANAATPADIAACIAGESAADPKVAAEAAKIVSLLRRSETFEIADRDEEIRSLLEKCLADPSNEDAVRRYDTLRSENVALAGKVMIERSDLLIAVWDRKMTDLVGGTGHTILAALEQGVPVLAIDPGDPENWSVLSRPEELGHHAASMEDGPDRARLRALLEMVFLPSADGTRALDEERWKPKGGFGIGFYRRLESTFGGRSVKSGTTASRYEAPDEIAEGSAAALLAAARNALGEDGQLLSGLRERIVPLFAWADGVSARLSDAYRSGMSINFLLSAFAIIFGIAYLPFDLAKYKWAFASVELALLLAIVLITVVGYRLAWHRRWFETRRLAEYLRFAPGIVLMGVARPIKRLPRGENGEWPERLSRDILRDLGLPAIAVDRTYLRSILTDVVLPHVKRQRSYHMAKGRQLHTVHHRLDRFAEGCFLAAIVSVTIYLAIEIGVRVDAIAASVPYAIAKSFTFMGVAFPTLGASIAGIRFFGDFERFAAISNSTASKLSNVEQRIELLLSGDERRLVYRSASDLVRVVDEIIVDEIENWQAVFGAKHLALPA